MNDKSLQPVAPGNLIAASPLDVLPEARRIADQLSDLIKERGLSTRIGNKDHVWIEGWQAAGSIVGVTAVVVGNPKILRNDDGKIVGFMANAEAHLVGTGQVVGAAWSMCDRSERRGPWRNAEAHALLGMAQTRAMSRALKGPLGWIVQLAGYDTTPAEVMDGYQQVIDGNADPDPEWGTDPELASQLAAAARAAAAKNPAAWTTAKLRARLDGASDDDRRGLLAELNAWLDANGVEVLS